MTSEDRDRRDGYEAPRAEDLGNEEGTVATASGDEPSTPVDDVIVR